MTWKTFRAKSLNGSVRITAMRSDGLAIQHDFRLQNEAISSACLVEQAINIMETYRNCHCTSESFCSKHKPKET